MDASKLILTLIKDTRIKNNLNILIYYALKLIYDPKFAQRSPHFGRAIKRLFDELGNNLDLQIAKLEENLKDSDNKLTFDMSIIDDVGPVMSKNDNDKKLVIDQSEEKSDGNCDVKDNSIDNIEGNIENNICKIDNLNTNGSDNSLDDLEEILNVTANKASYASINKLMKTDWKWCFEHLVDYDDDYILDKDEENDALVDLIKEYLISDVEPKNSSLMMCYNIVSSSIELFFCLKLVLNVPKFVFMRKEGKFVDSYVEKIKVKIENFYDEWTRIYWDKYSKNKLIKEIIGEKQEPKKEDDIIFDTKIQYENLTMCEPILTSKYVSFTKLIKEGPFSFDIEEAARQICIIDHELLSSLSYRDFSKFLKKQERPVSFDKFFVREKQLQCYILIFITMHNNLENKKNVIQNFILLAHFLKEKNNMQTANTIVAAFSMINLKKKRLLWKLIEKKCRDIFLQLEKEMEDMELNENPILKAKNDIEPWVPHVKYVVALLNNLVIKSKTASLIDVCREYRELVVTLRKNAKVKYRYFKVNPLYDFFDFGFLEIFKPKRWHLKSRFDFSNYTTKENKLEQLLNYLIKNFQNSDL